MKRIEQTRKAGHDLESAFVSLFDRNALAAQRLKSRIQRTTQLIAARPFLGRRRIEVHPDLRSVVIHPYVLFYVPIAGGVRIIRFLHGSRDLDAIMRDEPSD